MEAFNTLGSDILHDLENLEEIMTNFDFTSSHDYEDNIREVFPFANKIVIGTDLIVVEHPVDILADIHKLGDFNYNFLRETDGRISLTISNGCYYWHYEFKELPDTRGDSK